MPRKKPRRDATTTITHTVEFDAPAATLFELYADARKHARVIDASARFERRAGGAFSAWSGGVTGMNVVLRAPSLIVQAWRTEAFPSGHHSILHLVFEPAGRGRSRLTLTQHGVPRALAEEIEANWHACYWEPIGRLLAEGAGK